MGRRGYPPDPAVGEVVDLVEGWNVDPARARQPKQDLVTTTRTTLGLPRREQVGHLQDSLLAVAHDRGVDEVRRRLGVERRMTPRDDDRVIVAAIARMQGYAGKVERGQQVRVAELGGERDPEEVEVPQPPVTVHGELGDPLAAQERLHVRPHGVGPLGEGIGSFVDDLVQDHDALVGQTDLVGVGIHQRPARGQLLTVGSESPAVPVLDGGVELTTDVLDGFAHLLQERFKERKEGSTSETGPANAFGHAIKGRASPAHPCTSWQRPCA